MFLHIAPQAIDIGMQTCEECGCETRTTHGLFLGCFRLVPWIWELLGKAKQPHTIPPWGGNMQHHIGKHL